MSNNLFQALNQQNFWPIALTSHLAKCLERLIIIHLRPLVTDNNQFAYHQHRSTEYALIIALDTISEHLDANANDYVRGMFIDFTSAFNVRYAQQF